MTKQNKQRKLKIMKYLVTGLLLCLTSCGPSIPDRIDVVVSGSVGIRLDLSDLTQYFKYQCIAELGAEATEQQLSLCTYSKVASLLTYLQTVGK